MEIDCWEIEVGNRDAAIYHLVLRLKYEGPRVGDHPTFLNPASPPHSYNGAYPSETYVPSEIYILEVVAQVIEQFEWSDRTHIRMLLLTDLLARE